MISRKIEKKDYVIVCIACIGILIVCFLIFFVFSTIGTAFIDGLKISEKCTQKGFPISILNSPAFQGTYDDGCYICYSNQFWNQQTETYEYAKYRFCD